MCAVRIDPRSLDYTQLDDREFEELCFDLLRRLGYLNLEWRQGGADQGRDIEGTFDAANPLLGPLHELWFVQCKHYQDGVPPQPLNDAIAWADAGRPQHLLYILSSHPTNAARQWLDTMRAQKAYAVHILEGKELAELIVQYPEIVERYFFTEPRRLLREAMTTWERFGILPSPRHMVVFVSELRLQDLNTNEVAFLWTASRFVRMNTDYQWPRITRNLSYEELAEELTRRANAEGPPALEGLNMTSYSWGSSADPDGGITAYLRWAGHDEDQTTRAYAVTLFTDTRMLEVLFIPGEAARVRVLPGDATADFEATQARLFEVAHRDLLTEERAGPTPDSPLIE
jgi:hypothetical protein